MESKASYQKKIESQLTKWETTIDGLRTKIEQAEVAARAKLHAQLDRLHENRARAEKLLEELSATSQDAWAEIRSGIAQGWNEVTRTAKQTMANVREAIEHPSREDKIRQIAYQLWLDEDCPHGRHLDHWFKAESIWREQQATKQPADPPPAKAKRKSTVAAPHTESRAVKTKAGASKRSIDKP
jgi:hypothetical protein